MRVVTSVLAAALFGAMLIGATAQPASAATLDSYEADLLTQINSFRASKGLSTLRLSDRLSNAAQWMSNDMAAKDYFAHTSSDGRSPTQRMADAGYPAYSTWTGEDLAAGYDSAAEVLQGWIDSPAHYAVLVNPHYRAVGLGRAYSAASRYDYYWTADFGGVLDSSTTTTTTVSYAPPADHGFHAAWAGQSGNPTLAPGQTTTLVVALKNTGSRGWYAGQANLGTNAPPDISRNDLAYGWLSANRPGTITTQSVAPGQVGWFEFQVRAPSAPGTYRLDVRGVIDGVTWLEDQGIYFLITVR